MPKSNGFLKEFYNLVERREILLYFKMASGQKPLRIFTTIDLCLVSCSISVAL